MECGCLFVVKDGNRRAPYEMKHRASSQGKIFRSIVPSEVHSDSKLMQLDDFLFAKSFSNLCTELIVRIKPFEGSSFQLLLGEVI